MGGARPAGRQNPDAAAGRNPRRFQHALCPGAGGGGAHRRSPEAPATTADGLYPASPDRDWQTRLLDLCASGDLDMDRWRLLGPAFFMAGVAVMLASAPGFDRRALLKLAEQLHAGSTQVGVFTRWLERSPIRPSIFLPLLGA